MISNLIPFIVFVIILILLFIQIRMYIDLFKLSKPSAVKARIDMQYSDLNSKLQFAHSKAVSFAHISTGLWTFAAIFFYLQGFSAFVSFLIGCALFVSSLAFTAWQAPTMYTTPDAIKRAKTWSLLTFYILMPFCFIVIFIYLAIHTDPQTKLVNIQEINFKKVFLIIGSFFMLFGIGKNLFVKRKSISTVAQA
ncbi:MAG: hypothetical protein JWM56_1163 [Candidatus Peribacteria bacterium]|nr:hypothetical protein [Candidatus Peribacteria bacterium]